MKGKSPPVRPHFFTVILDETLQDRKLKIPTAFVSTYGKDIPSYIRLKDPTGTEWKMKVASCNGEFWMQNGWHEFAEHYSLCFGDFLVFRYEGDGHFHVIIFDMSASEIRYPSFGTRCKHSTSSGGLQRHEMEADGDVSSVEIFDSKPRCKKRRGSSPLPCPQPSKTMRSPVTNMNKRNLASTHNARDCGLGKASTIGVREAAGGGRLSDDKRYRAGDVSLEKQQPSSSQRKGEARQQALAFDSENPFFIVTMCPTYILAHRLRIPGYFAEEYLGQNSCEVILSSSGRTWTVEYSCVKYDRVKDTLLKENWRCFVRDNHLKVGDVCIFELLKGRNIILRVNIFRAMEEACNRSSPVGSASENVMNQVNCKTKSRSKAEYDPSCKDERSPSRKRRGKSLSLLSRSSKISRIDSTHKTKKESCSVLVAQDFEFNRYNTRTCKKAKPENSIDGEDVRSFKSQGSIGMFEESQRNKTARLENNQNPSCLSSRQGLEDSELFVSNHPFFEAVLQKYHLEQRIMTVPAWFMENLAHGERYVRLQTNTGLWVVKLLRYGKMGRLSGGWATFLRENSLQVGDICIFELTNSVGAMFNVSIVRHTA